MSLPRIFMIGWEFPPFNSGGLGTACEGLTSALSKLNIQQTFVLPKQLPFDTAYALVFNPMLPNVNFVHVNMPMYPYGGISSEDALYLKKRYGKNPNDLVDQAYDYAEIVSYLSSRNSHDIIHGHDWMTYPAALAAHRRSHKPMVLHVHSTEFDRTLNGNTNGRISQIEYDHLSQADRIITVSQYTKDIVCDKYKIKPDKISVVHNGVDLDAQTRIDINPQLIDSYLKNRKVVIFVGRFTSQKGPDYFVSVAEKISHVVPEAVFIMAGSGDMYNQILIQSAQSRLTGKIIFPGFLRDREREFLYRRADLFIMPSVSEPFGIVALEAAGAHTPVIISNQSGVSEVLHNAYRANFWDIDEIAKQAIFILNNDSEKDMLAKNLAQEARNITWGAAAAKCINVYKQLA